MQFLTCLGVSGATHVTAHDACLTRSKKFKISQRPSHIYTSARVLTVASLPFNRAMRLHIMMLHKKISVPSRVVPLCGWGQKTHIVWLKLLTRAWESVCRDQGIKRWCHLTHVKLGHLQRTCRTLRVENNIRHIERRKAKLP